MFFVDYIRNTSKKIDDLWQSKDEKYGNIKFGCALSLVCALIFICGYNTISMRIFGIYISICNNTRRNNI